MHVLVIHARDLDPDRRDLLRRLLRCRNVAGVLVRYEGRWRKVVLVGEPEKRPA
jgi:hypothetical protein